MGFPVAGNPTQFVMERAFKNAGVDSRCLTVEVSPADLPAAVTGMRAMGFRGATLACPHQESAIKLVDDRSKVAEALNEIDFIYREDGKLIGDHSLVRAATEVIARQVDIEDKHAMICGGDQVARAIALAICLSGPKKVTLFDKDDESAESTRELVNQYSSTPIEIQPWLEKYAVPSDVNILVVTGPEDDESIDPDSLFHGLLVMSTNAQSPRTDLIKAGEESGCVTINGLDLLVQQAIVAFRSWTGKTPDTRVVREAFEEFLMI